MPMSQRAVLCVVLALLMPGCNRPGPTPSPAPSPNPSPAAPEGPEVLGTSDEWTNQERVAFYSQDQGSQLIPLRWFLALKQPNNEAFGAKHLSRYGYLPNELAPDSSLPIGFTRNLEEGQEFLGMTCAACHTRQIEIAGRPYRIDGGPAMVDFQSFLADLDAAVERTLKSPEVFTAFAHEVLADRDDEPARADLRRQVEGWYTRFHTIISRSLPPNPWGPGRLDAVGMIFNRVTGLDIAATADGMIPENIHVADAPARYPFLWNAAIQDRTQWPGFAKNGNDLLGLARNLGEVYGVFGHLHPKPAPWSPLFRVDYITDNSANFPGLATLEDLIKKIPPPKFPGKINASLAKQGEEVFYRKLPGGSCADCHGIQEQSSLLGTTWKTPIDNVGTDTREFQLLSRTAKTGILEGFGLPFSDRLEAEEPAFQILRTVVVGAILQSPFKREAAVAARLEAVLPEIDGLRIENMPDDMQQKFDDLKDAFPSVQDLKGLKAALKGDDGPKSNAYESRVMQGIWAAAPYLHNGSVPTLEDLLEPTDKRPSEFEVGPEYDLERIGLARKQKKFNFKLKTTDASELNSGNSRAGHEFGTDLPPADKKALLEYLKSL
ncbi:MAG: di-heme-cytochrome C peroxidase [Planctomycetaceae bacterium]